MDHKTDHRKFKCVRISGNGCCLFISLRMGYEFLGILKQLKEGIRDVRAANFSGTSELAERSGSKLRSIVVSWYDKERWDIEVASLGMTRKQIIVRELSKEKDVTDEDVHEYIKIMRMACTWGSQPEYIAFACMACVNVEVYNEVGRLLDKVGSYGTTIRLCFRGNHYDLLVEADDVSKVLEAYPSLCGVFRDFPTGIHQNGGGQGLSDLSV